MQRQFSNRVILQIIRAFVKIRPVFIKNCAENYEIDEKRKNAEYEDKLPK